MVIAAGDSHTTTHGAMGALGFGRAGCMNTRYNWNFQMIDGSDPRRQWARIDIDMPRLA